MDDDNPRAWPELDDPEYLNMGARESAARYKEAHARHCVRQDGRSCQYCDTVDGALELLADIEATDTVGGER